MGRKSRAPQRRGEILDAFEAAVADQGIGVSLEEVARRAGLKRQLITHYFGDRTRLTDALKQRVAERYRATLSRIVESAGGDDGIGLARALMLRVSEAGELEAQTERVVDALWDARLLGDLHREFEATLSAGLAKANPDAPRSACDAVAYGLLALWIGHGDLIDNGFRSADPEAAYRCALALLGSLGGKR